eukprot:4065097-Prymnesium_polylepis.2
MGNQFAPGAFSSAARNEIEAAGSSLVLKRLQPWRVRARLASFNAGAGAGAASTPAAVAASAFAASAWPRPPLGLPSCRSRRRRGVAVPRGDERGEWAGRTGARSVGGTHS